MYLLLALVLPGQFVHSESFSVHDQNAAFSSAVRIIDWSDRGGRAGTGAIVGARPEEFFVLTAHHVVHPGKRLEVQLFDRECYPDPARRIAEGVSVIASNTHADLALLRVHSKEVPNRYFKIAPDAREMHDIAVLTIGCDYGSAPTCAVDTLKGSRHLPRPRASVRFWVTESTPVVGRSGGPLIGSDGYLIGVCRGFLTETAALPAQGIYASLEEIYRLMELAGLAVDESGELVALDGNRSWPRNQDQLVSASAATFVDNSRASESQTPAD